MEESNLKELKLSRRSVDLVIDLRTKDKSLVDDDEVIDFLMTYIDLLEESIGYDLQENPPSDKEMNKFFGKCILAAKSE